MEKYRQVFNNLNQMNQMNQMNSKPLLPGLGYGAQQAGHGHQQLSLAAAAVQLASGQLNGQLNGQLAVSSPTAGQAPPLFPFPHQPPPVANSQPIGLGVITSNGLLARDEESSEYLKHLNTLHYIKQLQQQQQQPPIGSAIKSERSTSTENHRHSPDHCSSPKLPNGQSNLGGSSGASNATTKLAKPQPVRHQHLSNTNSLQTVPTSK